MDRSNTMGGIRVDVGLELILEMQNKLVHDCHQSSDWNENWNGSSTVDRTQNTLGKITLQDCLGGKDPACKHI